MSANPSALQANSGENSHGYQNNSHQNQQYRQDQGQIQGNPYHIENSGVQNYSQMSGGQSHGQNTGGSGRPQSRGLTQNKISTNQMAKIQHHEDGRKHNVTLLSQQIPYPSTGQYPNQQPNSRYNFEENRSGSLMQNSNSQSMSQSISRDQNQQNIRSSSQNAAYQASSQNFIQYTDNIITGQNVHGNSTNQNKNQQKQYQNQISDLPYNNLKGEKGKDGQNREQNTHSNSGQHPHPPGSSGGNHQQQQPNSQQQQFEHFERQMQSTMGGSNSMQANSRTKGSQMHPINKTQNGITLSTQQKHGGMSFKERSSSAMVLQGDHQGPKILNNPNQMSNYEGQYNNINSQSNMRNMKQQKQMYNYNQRGFSGSAASPNTTHSTQVLQGNQKQIIQTGYLKQGQKGPNSTQKIVTSSNNKTGTINHSKSQIQMMNVNSPHKQKDSIMGTKSHFENRHKTQSQIAQHQNFAGSGPQSQSALLQQSGQHLKNINILNSQHQFMKNPGDNPNAQIAKRNHKYIPLSNQAKGSSGSSHDPNRDMMVGQTSSGFQQIMHDGPNDSGNKYKSKYVQQVQQHHNQQQSHHQQKQGHSQSRPMKGQQNSSGQNNLRDQSLNNTNNRKVSNNKKVKKQSTSNLNFDGKQSKLQNQQQNQPELNHSMPTAGLTNTSGQILREQHNQSRTPQRMASNNSKNVENPKLSIQPGMSNNQQTSSQQNQRSSQKIIMNNGGNQANLMLSGQGSNQLLTGNNGFLPNIKSRNSAQNHIYGGVSHQKSHHPLLQQNHGQGNSSVQNNNSKTMMNVNGGNQGHNGQSTGDLMQGGLVSMPTVQSMTATSVNSGQTIGPALSSSTKQILSNDQVNQPQFLQSKGSISTQGSIGGHNNQMPSPSATSQNMKKKRGTANQFEFVQNTMNVKSHTQSNQQLMKSQDFKKNSITSNSQHKTLQQNQQNPQSNSQLNIRKNSVDNVYNQNQEIGRNTGQGDPSQSGNQVNQAGGPAQSQNSQNYQQNIKDRPNAPAAGQNRTQLRSRNGMLQQQAARTTNQVLNNQQNSNSGEISSGLQSQMGFNNENLQRTMNGPIESKKRLSSGKGLSSNMQSNNRSGSENRVQSLRSGGIPMTNNDLSPNKTINQSQGSNLHHTKSFQNQRNSHSNTVSRRDGIQGQGNGSVPPQHGQDATKQQDRPKKMKYYVPQPMSSPGVGTGSQLPLFQNSKTSNKKFGIVRSFAANTHVGLVRKANEDRIAIILNVIQPLAKQPKLSDDMWPKIQIFAVYDGHGGNQCAEYLKEHLHNNIILQPEFPSNVTAAIQRGSMMTDKNYLDRVFAEYQATQKMQNCKSGSCCNLVMTFNDDLYIVNVGDSRAIGSKNQGAVALDLSEDHKPGEISEFRRIEAAGGHIYQTHSVINAQGQPCLQQIRVEKPPVEKYTMDNPLIGPYRVFPGRLSVCRTFGDLEAKQPQLGGNPNVVICDPDINFQKDGCKKLDYVLTCSDGIFDKLSTQEVHDCIWSVINHHIQDKTKTIHQIIGYAVDEVLHAAARTNSLDNISVVMIAFDPLYQLVESYRDN